MIRFLITVLLILSEFWPPTWIPFFILKPTTQSAKMTANIVFFVDFGLFFFCCLCPARLSSIASLLKRSFRCLQLYPVAYMSALVYHTFVPHPSALGVVRF